MRKQILTGMVLLGLVLQVAAGNVRAADPAAARRVDFNREVRTILSENCFVCHGPDTKARKGDLRLDQKAGAFRSHDGITVLVPGKPEQSELFTRITSTDAAEKMPPPDSGKALTAKQVQTIKQWIAEGADWKEHWSYVAPHKSAVPQVDDPAFVKNDIDRFLAKTLKDKGLAHSPEADRITLIRRLSFDLTGLPPRAAEVAEFVADTRPDAYERLVDRLLDSPQYGERMALAWLDMVRYADTIGIHSDEHRNVDLYRDYVIQAFNENKPFDQFTLEQLGGDLIEQPTRLTRVASGYNRLLMTTNEGGAQAKEYMAKYSADRVRNASTVWLGSTMGCSECHDHKFDPFLQKDFYKFASFFADVQEKAVGAQDEVPLPTSEQEAEVARLEALAVPLRKLLETSTPELVAAQTAWEQEATAKVSASAGSWLTVKPSSVESSGKATLTVQEDNSVLASGENPDRDTYTVRLPLTLANVTGFRLETLKHPSLVNGSLSRVNGNFVLTDVSAEMLAADEKTLPVKIASAVADFEQQGHPVALAIDNQPATGWAVNGHVTPADHAAVFVFAKPVTGAEGSSLVIRLKHESPYPKHSIGRFRVALTTEPKPSLSNSGFPEPVAAALLVESAKRDAAQKDVLAKHYRSIAPALTPVREQQAKLDEQSAAVKKSFRKTLVTTSMAPRTMRVLPRGNWLDETGEEVKPNVPSFLRQIETTGRANRLDLAKWIIAPDNPLTARVFVNRLWKQAFGQGIVKTLDDFGSQGAAPTHPELLDWLAVDFVEHGWNIKRTLKLLVTSGAYRQSSLMNEQLKQQDPYNQWVARQARYRLDAEGVRDNALLISGLLVQKLYGPSVRPYQPPGYWAHLNFPQREYQVDTGENLYRRGLYMYWCRTFLHPSLVAFDAPSREECTVERPRSNTPLQALVLLNDPNYVEAARAFAERIMQEGGADVGSRVKFAFTTAVSRAPRPGEQQVLEKLYEKHLAEYRSDEKGREALLTVGPHPTPKALDRTELAAWTSVARVILNLHETITRY